MRVHCDMSEHSGIFVYSDNPFDSSCRRAFRLRRPRNLLQLAQKVGAAKSERCTEPLDSCVHLNHPSICFVNGSVVRPTQWPTCVVGRHDIVVMSRLPAGCDCNPFKAFAQMAVFAFSWWAGPAAAAAMGLSGTAATIVGSGLSGIFAAAGTSVLNVMMPPSRPRLPGYSFGQTNAASASPTYTLSAQGNSARLEQTIPAVYGRHIIYPDFAAPPWGEFRNNQHHLHHLLVIGQGRYDITSVKIDDTPIANFKEIKTQHIAPGGSLSLFSPNVVSSQEVSGQTIDGVWLGPFVANPPGTRADQIALDIVQPRGLFSIDDKGQMESGAIEFSWYAECRQINDAGVAVGAWRKLGSGLNNVPTLSAIRTTYKMSVSAGRWEVRLRGSPPLRSTRLNREGRWFGLRSYLEGSAYPSGITLLAVGMQASDNLSSHSARRLNCVVTRKLPVWTQSGGWSAPRATRSIAWALCDMLKAQYGGRLHDTRMDLQEMARLDALWSRRGDTFNAVFDGRMSLWEALKKASMCGRAVPYQQGGKIRFARDSAKVVPVALFGPRNIVRGSLRVEYGLPVSDTPREVVVEYFDARSWSRGEVRQTATGTADSASNVQRRPARIELFGCTGHAQASREAFYLAQANRWRRRIAVFSTEMEGLIPTYGDMIAISHPAPKWGMGGEVVGWDAASRTLELSEPVPHHSGRKHYIALRARNGSPVGPFLVLTGADKSRLRFSEEPTSEVSSLLSGAVDGERVHFSFGPDNDWRRLARVIAVKPQGNNIQLTAVLEDSRVHQSPSS